MGSYNGFAWGIRFIMARVRVRRVFNMEGVLMGRLLLYGERGKKQGSRGE